MSQQQRSKQKRSDKNHYLREQHPHLFITQVFCELMFFFCNRQLKSTPSSPTTQDRGGGVIIKMTNWLDRRNLIVGTVTAHSKNYLSVWKCLFASYICQNEFKSGKDISDATISVVVRIKKKLFKDGAEKLLAWWKIICLVNHNF